MASAADLPMVDDLFDDERALSKPGKECLVLQPSETASPFTLTLKAGAYSAHWYNVKTRRPKTRAT